MEQFQEILVYLKKDNGYVLQVFIVILAALVLEFIQRKLLGKLQIRLEKTKNSWDDIFVRAIRRPLSLVIWVGGLYMAMVIIQDATKAVIFSAVEPIRDVAVVAAMAWVMIRIIAGAEENLKASDSDFDHTTVDAISKLLRISVIITTILVGLQTLGYSISGVLAFGGVGGIAVGFAARDLLANFFGGLMIYLDRPFSVGDWVRSPDRDIEGTIEKIGWRLTMVRTFDKRPLYVPNSVFNNIAVENPSRMSNRRIKETIGIRYEDAGKMGLIIDRVKTMLMEHEDIDTTKTLIVNFNNFAPSSLDFFIYTFTKTTNWIRFHEVKQDVLLKIIDIIQNEGVEFAYPTSTLHIADFPAGKKLEIKEPDIPG
ncbi:MAG: mechanosensitive ion channel family protein [Candidatus Nitronauta litoralis]|uniref:Mechanosensitive ion channel family protein n=1 Tax=Candidatus Nitronauta litoralis TaxID=2705533 RepID=A0A7T0FZ80_9BACT|nr:MAG: mechanosensitive ion channel family protein [Candidatus Nitronauta litoralis]